MVDNTDSMENTQTSEQVEKQEALREKASTVSSIKSIAVTQGGTPLTTENIVSLLDGVVTSLTNRVNHLSMNTTRQFLPVDSQLKQIDDLLTSNEEEDVDKGFQLIDKLQKRLGTDLSKYSKEMGDAIKKLYDMNQQQKDDKAEKERIRVERTQELTQERDILRERGINTFINVKENRLEIKSKREERLELKRIAQEEKDIEKAKKESVAELKELQKANTIDKVKQEEFLKEEKKLNAREEKLQKDKEAMNIKPGQRTSGMLDQSIGTAFRQIKDFGKEIGQIGGDIFRGVKKSFNFVTDTVSSFGKGFKKIGGDLMSGFGKLAGATKGLIVGFIGMFIAMIKFVLIALIVGVVIYAVFKAIMFVINTIKSVIDFFKDSFEKLMDIWPFSLIGNDDEAKKKSEIAEDKVESYGDNKDMADGDVSEKNRQLAREKILPVGSEIFESKQTIDQMAAGARTENLNKMSIENQAMNDSKSTNNTVIAPNVSNSSVNASNTQAMTMEPTNFDRSFINLNSVPV